MSRLCDQPVAPPKRRRVTREIQARLRKRGSWEKEFWLYIDAYGNYRKYN
jgi:hypothetical protein